MPLTTDELLMNMSESIELLINYIETAKTNGYTFPAELENDLADAKRNIETYNNKEYSDETII